MAKKKNGKLIKYSLTAISFFAVILGYSNISRYVFRPKDVLSISTDSDEAILFWEKISERNPTYLEASLELAVLEARKGNIKKSRYYLGLAQKIDPNSATLSSVRKTLGL